MENIDKRTVSHLILTAGFSRYNALEAIRMYHAGELTEIEKEVITTIRFDPENDKTPLVYYKGSEPKSYILDHLNYRITQGGGEPITPSKERKHWLY